MNDQIVRAAPETRTAVLKLRLGPCLTAPSKRMAADLHECSRLINRACNAMVRHWERFVEAKYGRTIAVQCKGLPRGRLNRKTGTRSAPTPPREIRVLTLDVPEVQELPKTFGTELYYAGLAVAPTVSPSLLALCSSTVLAGHILKRCPYNHPGTAKQMWQAIMLSEASRPCFRSAFVPIPCQATKLSATDSGYVLTFPLWSKDSGRGKRLCACRLRTARLSPGLKRILLQVATGRWKLCDSRLIFHEPKGRGKKGFWSLHMAYQRTAEPLNLDKDRTATLQLVREPTAERPFEMACPDGFPRLLGDAKVLVEEYERLDTRRLEMRARHRDRTDGRRGHGRQRVEAAIRPVSRKVKELMHRFSWRVISRAIEYCRRQDCGTLAWREPTIGQCTYGWFPTRGISYDWTGFRSRLEHKLWVNGIVFREWIEGGNDGSGQANGSGAGKEQAKKPASKPARKG